MAPLALLVLGLQLLTASGLPAPNCPTVTADSGVLVGTATSLPCASTAVNRFLGIPFAEPPIRFDPPQPAPNWAGVYDATQYKPACIQKFDGPEGDRERIKDWFATPPQPNGESEDCLYLNVYAPAGAAQGSKAVMFWLFGGSFAFGSGSLPLYDGSSFAANHDVVIVISNYRTNVFGFPGSPEKPQSEQNLGLLDQRLALDWVQRNIAAFGGDPSRVTLFGESAGAGSVDLLVSNPPEPVPFIGAIMQSGQSGLSLPNNDSARSWQKLIKAADCDPEDALECIRALPAEKIRDIIEREKLAFVPIYDDGETYASTGRLDRRDSTPKESRIARVPILIGSNADEGTILTYGMANGVTDQLLKQVPGSSLDNVNKLLGAYGQSERPGLGFVNRQLASVIGDFAFTCPAKVIGEESAAAHIPSWRYMFDAAFPNHEAFPGSGAWHSSEIGLIFGTYNRTGRTPYQEKLSIAMQRAWADFAKDPSGGPGWDSLPNKIAVFGAGVRPDAQGSASTPAFEVNDGAKYDGKCWLFKPIYDTFTLNRG
ncbi:hypothetical protein XA68_13969 [Ophiocordyceps unilateralis]|uniref:Carboxylic ester hydrolase n=1 Tax=Ophiocordyceps unilateralis TaxID=268505 RepID=A0A2A9PLL0_OPHUN|nr:hypothetical protein XA68_13969 [Ophiocordyceps unilateralis]